MAAEDSEGVESALDLVSMLGQMLADSPLTSAGVCLAPQAGLARAARVLEVAADLLRTGAPLPKAITVGSALKVADAFAKDARTLRRLVAEHGRRAGPSSRS